MTEGPVQVTIDGHVAEVALNRPEKHNALDAETFHGLNAAVDRLAQESTVRAVVLHGHGRSFSAGLDLATFGGDGPGAGTLLRPVDGSPANIAQRVAYGWRELEVPVIAAVQGNCLGGGMQIALGADLRIAAPGARFSVREIVWGLVPDMAISQTLPRLVGADVAKELIWTGRLVDASEALQLGLVTRIEEDPLAAARALAAEIAGRSPHAIRAGKRLVDESWARPPAEGLALEEQLQRTLLNSPNMLEAVRAGLGGTTPTFSDPD